MSVPVARVVVAIIAGLTFCPAARTQEMHAPGMDMGEMHNDDPLLFSMKLDQLEVRGPEDRRALAWDGEGWVGKDLNKLWLKIDGEQDNGALQEFESQLLYSRAVDAFWDMQAGWRRDVRARPVRDWFVLGVKGIAPYWFDVDGALFIGESGRVALRFEAEYEFLLTQRLILAPDVEINVYGSGDTVRQIGSGLSDFEAGLRLRYEIRPEFAPYLGVNWKRRFGETGDLAHAHGEAREELQAVAGVRFWF